MKFTVTDKAGSHIAGMKNPGAGETITLTEREAAHDLRSGAIIPQAEAKKAPAKRAPAKGRGSRKKG